MNHSDRTTSAAAVDDGGPWVRPLGDFPTDWCVTGHPQDSSPAAPPNRAHRDEVWIEHLGVDDCWALLSETPVGRIGVLVDSAPEIYPVNHLVDGATIVFRTDPGGKLRGLERTPLVSYQVDGADCGKETGWSVLVKGRATEVRDTPEVRRLASLPLRYWGVGEKAHWVRILPTEVTGRRIHRVGAAER
jgi:nitroimidazol reductase NimA-like FMN-containing flavoprotein (pyridoxamine 5'-phosphate oxidase superfamily)